MQDSAQLYHKTVTSYATVLRTERFISASIQLLLDLGHLGGEAQAHKLERARYPIWRMTQYQIFMVLAV